MRSPKPRGLDEKYARQFCDESVAAAYEHRPPYPDEVFDVLDRLMSDRPRRMLDIGCGRGEIARGNHKDPHPYPSTSPLTRDPY